jgi:hypothetical protein
LKYLFIPSHKSAIPVATGKKDKRRAGRKGRSKEDWRAGEKANKMERKKEKGEERVEGGNKKERKKIVENEDIRNGVQEESEKGGNPERRRL